MNLKCLFGFHVGEWSEPREAVQAHTRYGMPTKVQAQMRECERCGALEGRKVGGWFTYPAQRGAP